MKKVFLPLFLMLCMVVMLAPTVSAAETNIVLPDGVTAESFGTNTVTDGTDYYPTLQAAVEAVTGESGTVLYCKPNSDVGSLQHAPVTATLTVYGNGASVTGNTERDFDIGNTDPSGGRDITADMTLTVYALNGCGAWGTKATDHTVNLVFNNCRNMGKVFITGMAGTLNITMTDCAFEGVIAEAVYSNANGNIELTRVDFSNLNKAVNLNHKVAGTQNVVITDCTFTNCGNDVANDQIPVRVLSSVEGGNSMLKVSGCSFSGTPEGGADILLDYGIGTTSALVSDTSANLFFEEEENVATKTEVTTSDTVSFKNFEPVAKIGDDDYPTLQLALEAAAEGDNVTIQLLPGTFELGEVVFPAILEGVTIKGAENKGTILKNTSFVSAPLPSTWSDPEFASKYHDITIDGIVFDNSFIKFTGWANVALNQTIISYADWTITNCEFYDVETEAAVYFNLGTNEHMNGFTFTNNVIDGVTGQDKSGVGVNMIKGKVTIIGNDIQNVNWNAIQIQNTTEDTEIVIEDNVLSSDAVEGIVNIANVVGDLTVDGNTMSQSADNQPFFCHVDDAHKEDGFISSGFFKGSSKESVESVLEEQLVDGFQLFTMANGEYGVAETGADITVAYDGYYSVTVKTGTVLPEFVPDNDGDELVGWYTEPEFINKVDFSRPFIANTTLYPCWKDDKHDIDTGYVMIIMKMLEKLDISVEIIETEGGKIVVVVPEKVKYNKPAVCTVIPDEGYAVKDVIVDGESVGAVTEYTIEKLKGKHTVTAVFEIIEAE